MQVAFDSTNYLDRFVQLVEKGKTILDIGCGDGNPLDAYLIQKGYAVNGIDISPQQIALAKKNIPQAFYEVKDVYQVVDGEYCVNGIVSFSNIFSKFPEQQKDIFKRFVSFMPSGGPFLMGPVVTENSEEENSKVQQFLEEAGFELVLVTRGCMKEQKRQVILANL